jgi:hypothetical protein
MNELWQSSEREGSTRFALLKRASAARWIPNPLRLMVGCVTHHQASLTPNPDVYAHILSANPAEEAIRVGEGATLSKSRLRRTFRLRLPAAFITAQTCRNLMVSEIGALHEG